MADYQSVIYICDHCGERMKSKAQHCPACRTAEGRRKITEENEKIRAERNKDI